MNLQTFDTLEQLKQIIDRIPEEERRNALTNNCDWFEFEYVRSEATGNTYFSIIPRDGGEP